MQVCECVCAYKNGIGNVVAYDLRFRDGSVSPISEEGFIYALEWQRFSCKNVSLIEFGHQRILHIQDKDKLPVISKDLYGHPELAQEIDSYVQVWLQRYKISGAYTNLEVVFDAFLGMKEIKGTVYTPMTQYCIYEYMKNLVSWDLFSTYIDNNGIIVFDRTNIVEGVYTIRNFVIQIGGRQMGSASPFQPNIKCLKVINKSVATDLFGLFSNIHADCLDLSEFSTKGVTRMAHLFANSLIRELDLRSFDTSMVTDMQAMFFNNHMLERLNLSSFDTRKVTYMRSMFQKCESLRNLNLDNFDTSKVEWMNEMFSCCDIRTWNISNLDMSKVSSAQYMFSGCKLKYTQLLNLNFSKVTNLAYIFSDCKFENGECDLSTLDFHRGVDMTGMLSNSNIEEIKLPAFSQRSSFTAREMFKYCAFLHSLELDFGFRKVNNLSELCKTCLKLEVLTLKGVDFSHINTCHGLILGCCSIRVLNLECRNLDAAALDNLLPHFDILHDLVTINMQGSDAGSIALMKRTLTENGFKFNLVC